MASEVLAAAEGAREVAPGVAHAVDGVAEVGKSTTLSASPDLLSDVMWKPVGYLGFANALTSSNGF